MVADERKARAETEEELKELRMEKEALRSALKLIDGENAHLRETTSAQASPVPPSSAPGPGLSAGSAGTAGGRDPLGVASRPASRSHSRSSSQIGIKSRPESLDLSYYDNANAYPPLPPSPAPGQDTSQDHSSSSPDSQETPLSIGVEPPTASASGTGSSSTQGHGALSPGPTSPEEESQPTPRWRTIGSPQDELFMGSKAWADVPSRA